MVLSDNIHSCFGVRMHNISQVQEESSKHGVSSCSNVLIIAYTFPPIAYVGSHRTIRFCIYLPENGWIPHVLTIEEGDDLDNDYNLLKRLPEEVKIYRTKTVDFWRMQRKRQAKKNEENENLNGQLPHNGQAENRQLNRRGLLKVIKEFVWFLVTTPDHMVLWVPFAIFKGVRILRKDKYDVIYTTSPPHSEQLIGYFLAKLFRKKWVADFRDPILDSSGYSPSPFRHWVNQFLEKLVVSNAHRIIIISQNYMEKMQDRYPWAEDKFCVLPNGYDPEIYSASNAESFDKFTILYAGSFYAQRKPDFFLDGLQRWFLQRPDLRRNVQVLFYGLEASMKSAKKIVSEMALQDVVHFPGMISQDELIRKQKGAHLLLLIIGFDPESRGTVTSKIFEYIASDRPILAIIPPGDAADILHDYHKLYWVDKKNLELLIDSLDAAYNIYIQKEDSEDTVNMISTQQKKSPYSAREQTKVLASLFS